jgi:hypothetical protein
VNITPVAPSAPLSPVADKARAPWDGTFAGQQAPDSPPAAADLLKFQQAMGDVQRVHGPAGAQSASAVPGVGKLQSISNYLTKRGAEMADLQEKNIKRRDVQSQLDLAVKTADNNFENELLVTAIGKTFSSITELTKLS